MRHRTFRALSAFTIVLVSVAVASAVMPQQPVKGPPPERGPGAEGGPQGRGASIEGSMKAINRATKTLKGQITDGAKKDENLKLINDMQRGCVAAKGQMLPSDVLAHAPNEVAKGKMNDIFRRDLMKALQLMLDIENDLIDGHNDAAKTKLDHLDKLREESHKALGVKEED